MEPKPLSISGAVWALDREYSRRLCNQCLISTPHLYAVCAIQRRTHLAEPRACPLRTLIRDNLHQLAADCYAIRHLCCLCRHLRRGDSKPQNYRHRDPRAHPPQELDRTWGQLLSRPRNSRHRHAVYEARGDLGDPVEPIIGRGGCHERADRYPPLRSHLPEVLGLVYGEVWDHEPRNPRPSRLL